MKTSHMHPDMIVLQARCGDIDREFQSKSREYGTSGFSVGARVASAIACIAAISIIVAHPGLWG